MELNYQRKRKSKNIVKWSICLIGAYGPVTVIWTTVDPNMDHSHSEGKKVAMSTRRHLNMDSEENIVGETGASCYRGRLLQGRCMQNYHIDGEIADSSCIRIHQRNH